MSLSPRVVGKMSEPVENKIMNV